MKKTDWFPVPSNPSEMAFMKQIKTMRIDILISMVTIFCLVVFLSIRLQHRNLHLH